VPQTYDIYGKLIEDVTAENITKFGELWHSNAGPHTGPQGGRKPQRVGVRVGLRGVSNSALGNQVWVRLPPSP